MRFVKAAGRGIAHAGLAVARAVPALLRDALGLAGAGMIVFGIWQIHQPSAWIASGLMLVASMWRLARPASRPISEEA